MRVFGQLQRLSRAGEDEMREVKAERFVSFLEDCFGRRIVLIELKSHANNLGALTRKQKSRFHTRHHRD